MFSCDNRAGWACTIDDPYTEWTEWTDVGDGVGEDLDAELR